MDYQKLSLSLVMPAYNEELLIEDTILSAFKKLPSIGIIDFEVIVVDDGSRDATAEILRRLSGQHKNLTVITHEKNMGLGAALRSGFGAAKNKYIFYTDADRPVDFGCIKDLFEARGDSDIVYAYRSSAFESRKRWFISWGYNFIIRRLFGVKLRDINFACKLFKRSVLKNLELASSGSFIDAEFAIRAKELDFKIKQVPVRYFHNTYRKSWLCNAGAVLFLLKEMLIFMARGRLQRLVSVACLALAFSLPFLMYLRTLSPTISGWDGGMSATEIYTFGVGNPPGFPLYIILGWLFINFLNFGSIAYRANVMSAFFASLACSVLYMLILQVLRGLKFSKRGSVLDCLTALGTSLAFAFSFSFWSQATVAEEYTLSAFLMITAVLFLLRWLETYRSKFLLLFALCWGLSLSNHAQTIGLGPAAVCALLVGIKQKRIGPRLIFLSAALFAVGLAPYCYIPFRARFDPAVNWSDIRNFSDFLNLIFVGEQRGILLSADYPRLPEKAAIFWNLIPRQFGWAGLLPGIVGLSVFLKRRLIDAGLILATLVSFLVLCVGYHWETTGISAWSVPVFMIFSIFIAVGLRWFISKLRVGHKPKILLLGSLMAAFVIVTILQNYSYCDKGKDFFHYDFANNILKTAGPDSIVITKGDSVLFSLWYIQHVEGRGRGVIFAHKAMLGMPWYRRQFYRRNYEWCLMPPGFPGLEREQAISLLVDLNIDKKDVFLVYYPEPALGAKYNLIPCGLLYKVVPKARGYGIDEVIRKNSDLWSSYQLRGIPSGPRSRFLDEAAQEARKYYRGILFNTGNFYKRRGRPQEADSYYKKSLEIHP